LDLHNQKMRTKQKMEELKTEEFPSFSNKIYLTSPK
jgi:hypothetical protein